MNLNEVEPEILEMGDFIGNRVLGLQSTMSPEEVRHPLGNQAFTELCGKLSMEVNDESRDEVSHVIFSLLVMSNMHPVQVIRLIHAMWRLKIEPFCFDDPRYVYNMLGNIARETELSVRAFKVTTLEDGSSTVEPI